jgi:FlaA1/EpsC-like NDP-sugar epimerase
MSISDAASMILKIGHIAKDSETFILIMTAVKIEALAKTMIQVFREKNKLHQVINELFDEIVY